MPLVSSEAEPSSAWGFFPFTCPINGIGHPAASVPCGFSSDGLRIIGRKGDEETAIAASAAFGRARPWAHRNHRKAIQVG